MNTVNIIDASAEEFYSARDRRPRGAGAMTPASRAVQALMPGQVLRIEHDSCLSRNCPVASMTRMAGVRVFGKGVLHFVHESRGVMLIMRAPDREPSGATP